jgi:hypothetical protein
MSEDETFDRIIRDDIYIDHGVNQTKEFDGFMKQVGVYGTEIREDGITGEICVEITDEGIVGVSSDEDVMTSFTSNYPEPDPETLVGKVISSLFLNFDLIISKDDIEDYSLDTLIYLGIEPDGTIYSEHLLTPQIEIKGYKYISICVKVYYDEMGYTWRSYTKVMRIPWANEPED